MTQNSGNQSARDLQGKTVLLTGATAGIGRATAQALAAELLSAGAGQVQMFSADLSRLADVRRVAQDVQSARGQLHVLINNAGAFFQTREETVGGLECTLALNHLSPTLLTHLLTPLLTATPASRVVMVSSSAQANGHLDFDDLQGQKRYSGFRAYSQSKLANVVFSNELARRLAPHGVTSNALHPGVVNSNVGPGSRGVMGLGFSLIKRFGAISPQQGAQTTLYLAAAPDVQGVTGQYFDRQKPARVNPEAQNVEIARRLWEVSEGLVGLG
ncbi:SDR family NAD(P)-dependent oxidoreductase [Deinococcus sp. Arct2-2]|uniref:SDR family NAD(P)-dependent oxidoreductase n=1 Tax=Deinococcus sp. Arct2-2 TaxID=2568653 RepID=UPI0010A2B2EB|nr:SDR family NAD(P)-dependent oxidoreductase [Deinococcus sp. Arct2-2]THF71620.1 SDR family NAD(P)-dependent oxidoreductase [Deinococcus sp. Arct2-2]